MGCTRPLVGIWKGDYTAAGKKKYVIDGKLDPRDCPPTYDHILIRCGKCPDCRMNYAREWADRCFLEMQDHKESWFITISYDDDHLPKSYHVSDETGEYFEHATLKKRDWQLFMKRLRKNSGQQLKFFACGEYGDHSFRPHMHAIVFGLHLDPLRDLHFYKNNHLNQPMYNSDLLDSCWTDEAGQLKGFIVAAPATYETIAYTCRYVTKKAGEKNSLAYEAFGIEPVWTLMSRRKALGRNWYDNHKEELFASRCVYLPKLDGSQQIVPGRYFRNLFEVDNPDESAILKARNRELSEKSLELTMSLTDLDYFDRLGVDEENLKNRLRALPRATF